MDESFFKIFDFGQGKDLWLEGNPETALKSPGSVVLTEKLRQKYFRNNDALGKVVRLNNSLDLTVTGVVKDFPPTTDFPFTFLISLNSQPRYNVYMEDWVFTSTYLQNYVLLKDKNQAAPLEDKFPKLITKTMGEEGNDRRLHLLQPMDDIHFSTAYDNFNERTVSRETLGALGLIGFLLILTASINFINLATAQATKRAKEIGIRKVLGSSRYQLMFQFLSEIFVITCFAFLLSILLVFITLPWINNLLEISIGQYFFLDLENVFFLLIALFVISFAAGIYPSLILSGFNPIDALKSNYSFGKSSGISGIGLRRSLIIVQFTITQILIIGTIVIISQNNYFSSKKLGFSKDAIITIYIPNQAASILESLRARLLDQPAVESVSFNFGGPTAEKNNISTFRYLESESDERLVADVKFIDEYYLETYDLNLMAGRKLHLKDTSSGILINEKMVELLGIPSPEEAVGKVFEFIGEREVMGVVTNFHVGSLKDEVKPLIMLNRRNYMDEAGIRLNPNDIAGGISSVERIWSETYPDYVFNYTFLDETVGNLYKKEEKLSHLFTIFSFVSICIGAMGLFGLISYLTSQKTKEVGIRKVMGASIGNIWLIFGKELGVLIIVAFIISSPIAYYFLNEWLQDYHYRIDISPLVFVLVLLINLVICAFSVGYKTYKAAVANPVKSLRSE